MNDFDRCLEVVRTVAPNAQAHVGSVSLYNTVVIPAAMMYDDINEYLLVSSGTVLGIPTVERRVSEVYLKTSETTLVSCTKVATHPRNIARYLTFGEFARQLPEKILLGLFFDLAFEVEKPTISRIAVASLFAEAGDEPTYKAVQMALNPWMKIGYDELTNLQSANILLQRSYGDVPLKSRASRAAGDEYTDSGIITPDRALSLAEGLSKEFPEDSKRAQLTRYLLHQLNTDAKLFKNDIALAQIHGLIDQGVTPFTYDELQLSVEQTVTLALEVAQQR